MGVICTDADHHFCESEARLGRGSRVYRIWFLKRTWLNSWIIISYTILKAFFYSKMKNEIRAHCFCRKCQIAFLIPIKWFFLNAMCVLWRRQPWRLGGFVALSLRRKPGTTGRGRERKQAVGCLLTTTNNRSSFRGVGKGRARLICFGKNYFEAQDITLNIK